MTFRTRLTKSPFKSRTAAKRRRNAMAGPSVAAVETLEDRVLLAAATGLYGVEYQSSTPTIESVLADYIPSAYVDSNGVLRIDGTVESDYIDITDTTEIVGYLNLGGRRYPMSETYIDVTIHAGYFTPFGRGNEYTTLQRGQERLTARFDAGQITAINVTADDGSDYVSNDTWKPATISGGLHNDTLVGGLASDWISGDGYHDRIWGRGGSDTLIGGTGNDHLNGDSGHDWLSGGDGNDVLRGGSGVDSLYGGQHDDELFGDNQNDWLYGEAGSDTLTGGSGNDRLYGGYFSAFDVDSLLGGTGNDSLYGGYGHDILDGEAGDDSLSGGNGNDLLKGGADDDTLYGGNHDDTLFGGSGEDSLSGGNHNDDLYGGDDDDTLRGGSGNDGLFGGEGKDYLSGSTGSDRYLILAGNGYQVEDQIAYLATNDARILFIDGNATVKYFSSSGWLNIEAAQWSSEEVEQVDVALSYLVKTTGNTRLLKTSDGDEFAMYRHGDVTDYFDGSSSSLGGWNNDQNIYFVDNTFASDEYTIKVVFHEIAHFWDEPEENSFVDDFRAKSGWRYFYPWQNTNGYIASESTGWFYLEDAEFARNYGRENYLEDFATSFTAYLMTEMDVTYTSSESNEDLAERLEDKFNVLDDFFAEISS